MIKCIISGGQVGADIAGLRAAKRLGLKTGGWAPRGFKTMHGPNMELQDVYGLDEHDSPLYPARTFLNVSDADATVRFATHFNSPGERCTFKAIRKYNKPYLDIKLTNIDRAIVLEFDPAEFKKWANQYKVLNVAGNANPGIEQIVEDFLVEALKR